MGSLHDGHISLVDISKQHTEFQVMSIFVNRLHFNDVNDFNTYPKDLERDFAKAEKGGVDLIFTPDDTEMYRNNLTTVDVDMLTENLCGAHRPGHFKGVFTVVSKHLILFSRMLRFSAEGYTAGCKS
jgi:pantoate--beta-alanine ligase